MDKGIPYLSSARLELSANTPMQHLEQKLTSQFSQVEAWFQEQWQLNEPLVYSSVDLRNAGYKIAPIDTNLFPAGFNNLSEQSMSWSVRAMRTTLQQRCPHLKQVLLIPENHSRNRPYFESIATLQTIIQEAGFEVRVGSLREDLTQTISLECPSGRYLKIEPVQREGNRLQLSNFDPTLIILNQDLSGGMPSALQNLEQTILPPLIGGWLTRSKTHHFSHYQKMAASFAEQFGIDPWLINPLFRNCGDINFKTGEGDTCLYTQVTLLLAAIQKKYDEYGITHSPYAVIKADAGTYGMAVMTVKNPEEVKALNRKQRTKMAKSKGGQAVSSTIVQEGVYTFESVAEGLSAEPVIYMIGSEVIGGFYRAHEAKDSSSNLNAPGMSFHPMPVARLDNNKMSELTLAPRYYVYTVIARLAQLAGAHELNAMSEDQEGGIEWALS